MNKIQKIFLVLCIVIITVVSANGQSGQKQQPAEEGTIKIDSFLVNLPMVVSDKQNRYISNLKQEDFTVYENDVEQQITFFSSDLAPCQIVILIDCSGSTDATIDSIKQSGRDFIKNLRDQDQAMVITFSDILTITQQLTSDKTKLTYAINSISAGGSTKIYDSVYIVAKDILSKITGRKAFILLTDGQDTTSGRSPRDAVDQLVESGALAYVVQYPTSSTSNSIILSASSDAYIDPRQPINQAIDDYFPTNTGFLTQITEVTGGRFYKSDIGNLSVPISKILDELHNVYVIGYYPSNPIEKQGYRKIKVKPRKDLPVAIHYRTGYDAARVSKNLEKISK